MILPIHAYGDPVLRKKAKEIEADYPGLQELIDNMFDTMYEAPGVGLAAPQIGLSIRLFVVDSAQLKDEDEDPESGEPISDPLLAPTDPGMIEALINPVILEKFGDSGGYEEGCLSLPGIREMVFRPPTIRIRYQDRHFNTHEKEISGFTARIIQHEFDHIEGILFTDHLTILKKTLIKKKLQNIMEGKARPDYKMKFANKKGR
jgi:peptide deformylase